MVKRAVFASLLVSVAAAPPVEAQTPEPGTERCESLESWPGLTLCSTPGWREGRFGTDVVVTYLASSTELRFDEEFPYGGDETSATVAMEAWTLGPELNVLALDISLDVEGLGQDSCDYGLTLGRFVLLVPGPEGFVVALERNLRTSGYQVRCHEEGASEEDLRGAWSLSPSEVVLGAPEADGGYRTVELVREGETVELCRWDGHAFACFDRASMRAPSSTP